MTEKLYYEDSHIFEFTAMVEACREVGGGYEIRLDRTAFFPGGGGQEPDSGFLGEARVTRAREEGDEIYHLCDRAIAPGTQVQCALDREQRLRRMQNHSESTSSPASRTGSTAARTSASTWGRRA